ncbi:MAG TPA: elongation factor P maturation arginine rhamnosyltransferase EarP [Methylophilus sp.]|uniref:elongation factor P maturation arginine rhamnosyltransferase EarP n=1 Tax=Methylophilus sp. TaxID=29541 RepID=UPI002BCAF65B|nr:elongation factor P maturation arginine rhamnosyltransferase EarP [Methylophilus sp.]HSH87737.1 elongation factor P maturation arginine rhamnosyltransferase EarP [Methylophilus sp.]
MSSVSSSHWDIFCQVVDNFGDIGVSWRLACQLADAHGRTVTLWVDDLTIAEKIFGAGHPKVQIRHWNAQADFSKVAPVVVETFSCGLPERYQQAMSPKTLWLNVDYLTAEDWVEGFHGRPSPQANGLVRYFIYPGFSMQTGGLLREDFLPAIQRQAQQSAPEVWRHLGLAPSPNVINISLFCYAHAPIKGLLDSLARSTYPSRLIVSESVAAAVSQALGLDAIDPGQSIRHFNCEIVVIPFLPQIDYDRLLALCDVNFVRGEDSWIRAIWAAKPMVWLPYQQSENTHLQKLDAFLNHYLALANDEVKAQVKSVMQAWAAGVWSAEDWDAFISHRDQVKQHSQAFATHLSKQPDLATNLMVFVEKLRENRV